MAKKKGKKRIQPKISFQGKSLANIFITVQRRNLKYCSVGSYDANNTVENRKASSKMYGTAGENAISDLQEISRWIPCLSGLPNILTENVMQKSISKNDKKCIKMSESAEISRGNFGAMEKVGEKKGKFS